MTQELSDDDVVAHLRESFDALSFDHGIGEIACRPAPRRIPIVAAAAVVGVVVVGAALLVAGGERAAYGWTPAAQTPTEDELQAALDLCDTRYTVTSDGVIERHMFERNTEETPIQRVLSLDLRGETGIATLRGPDFATMCIIDTAATPWRSDGSTLHMDLSTTARLDVRAITEYLPGRTVLLGRSPVEVTRVSIDVPDVEPFEVEVIDGTFLTWVPVVVNGSDATVAGFDATGAAVDRVAIVPWAVYQDENG